jgi:hypothetical protein
LIQENRLKEKNGTPFTQDISIIDVNDVVDNHYGIVEGERPVDRLTNGRNSDYVSSITAQPNDSLALNRRFKKALKKSHRVKNN